MTQQNSGGRLLVTDVRKRFSEVVALDGVSLEFREGEFVTLLGPSGCGKTTLLRIVAGFDWPDHGTVVLDGEDITRLPPYHRPVNTVFQKPVLLPHLDVFENIAFGLRSKRMPEDQIHETVTGMLEVVRLAGFERRRSDELSGGQAQRVNLARALVNQPRVLLLDEPLSALDLQVRMEMQAELKRIHRETGVTFLYVTHDQQEAMAMSDRIAVMDEGMIRQSGTPMDVYHAPNCYFVASFVGNANVLPVIVDSDDETGNRVRVTETDVSVLVDDVPEDVRAGWISMRPETLRLTSPDEAGITGRVTDRSFLGAHVIWRVDVGPHEIRVQGDVGADEVARSGDLVGIRPDPRWVRFLGE